MHAAQLAFTRTAVASRAPCGDDHGEAVVVMPHRSGAFDDRAFAAHAAFAWRSATQTLAGPGGGALRYARHRWIAAFSSDMPRHPQPGDRITRCWDGAVYEVVAAHREAGRLCCELVALDDRIH